VLDATTKDFRVGSEIAYIFRQNIHKRGLGIWPSIGKMLLELIPDTFVGIQFGSIGWKVHQVKAARTKEKFLDRITPMDLTIVPKNDYVPPDLMQKVPQEQGYFFALNVIFEKLAIQGAVESSGADRNARYS
jgi:hypothetical protein